MHLKKGLKKDMPRIESFLGMRGLPILVPDDTSCLSLLHAETHSSKDNSDLSPAGELHDSSFRWVAWEAKQIKQDERNKDLEGGRLGQLGLERFF